MLKATKDLKITKKGWELEIKTDDTAENPLNSEDFGIYWALFHKRYNLYNNTELHYGDYSGWNQLIEAIEDKYQPQIILPIYMYDHSGLALSLSDFRDHWDSNQIGYVFIKEGTSQKEFDGEEKKFLDYIESALNTYEDYLNGKVFYFELFKDGTLLDSCGGFYGTSFEENGLKDALLENAPEDVVNELLTNLE